MPSASSATAIRASRLSSGRSTQPIPPAHNTNVVAWLTATQLDSESVNAWLKGQKLRSISVHIQSTCS
ncbi:hypothetical protein, partial [Vibrio alginolyticus]|uniref:hypothetical protein n=1 Tax=Vibrio alginolyticus TaxID=663 RepID=UPI001EEC11A4